MEVKEFMDEANAYFAQLDDQEKYAWLAEGLGLGLIVVGIVLLV